MARADGQLDERSLQTALRTEIARRVADREIPDDVVRSVTTQLAELHGSIRQPLRGLRICPWGICLDYFVEVDRIHDVLGGVLRVSPRLRDLRVFPWGIIDTDLYQVVAEHQFDELAPVVGGAGLPGAGTGSVGL